MGEHRHAAGVEDPGHRRGEKRPVGLDVAGLAVAEVLLEGGTNIGHQPRGHQRPGEVGPPQRALAPGLLPGPGQGVRQADLLEPLGDAPGALLPGLGLGGEPRDQVAPGSLGQQSHHVDVDAAPLGRELGAGNQADALRAGGGLGRLDAVHGVVVGQRHQGHPLGPAQRDHLGRRQGAVGGRGVHVQVDAMGLALESGGRCGHGHDAGR